MASIRTNAVNAYETTLSSALATGATTINVTDTTGSPAVPFYIVIDPGNDAKREVVLVDGAKTATTFTLSAATSRGQDGTSDVAHDSGAVVAIVPIAAMWNDLHDRVDTKANDADVVKLAGAQTITGAKTFSTDPTLADGSSALSVTEGNAAYEAKVSRTGATAGEVPVLQADNTLAFGAAGGVTSEGFRAYRSTAQTLSAATHTTVIFDTEVRDDGADYNNATGEWTVPATGWYDVAAYVYAAIIAAGEQIGLSVFVNGVRQTSLAFGDTPAANDIQWGGCAPLYLVAADVVTIRALRGSAGDLTGSNIATFFTAKRRY